MAKLSDDEQAQLDALTAKRDAPDEQKGGGRTENVDVYIDLSDEAAVQRAIDHGFLTRKEAEDLKEGEGGEGGNGEGGEGGEGSTPPRRKLDRRFT